MLIKYFVTIFHAIVLRRLLRLNLRSALALGQTSVDIRSDILDKVKTEDVVGHLVKHNNFYLRKILWRQSRHVSLVSSTVYLTYLSHFISDFVSS